MDRRAARWPAAALQDRWAQPSLALPVWGHRWAGGASARRVDCHIPVKAGIDRVPGSNPGVGLGRDKPGLRSSFLATVAGDGGRARVRSPEASRAARSAWGLLVEVIH